MEKNNTYQERKQASTRVTDHDLVEQTRRLSSGDKEQDQEKAAARPPGVASPVPVV